MLPVADYDSIVEGDTSLLDDDYVDEDWKDSDSRRRHFDILERWVLKRKQNADKRCKTSERTDIIPDRCHWFNTITFWLCFARQGTLFEGLSGLSDVG